MILLTIAIVAAVPPVTKAWSTHSRRLTCQTPTASDDEGDEPLEAIDSSNTHRDSNPSDWQFFVSTIHECCVQWMTCGACGDDAVVMVNENKGHTDGEDSCLEPVFLEMETCSLPSGYVSAASSSV